MPRSGLTALFLITILQCLTAAQAQTDPNLLWHAHLNKGQFDSVAYGNNGNNIIVGVSAAFPHVGMYSGSTTNGTQQWALYGDNFRVGAAKNADFFVAVAPNAFAGNKPYVAAFSSSSSTPLWDYYVPQPNSDFADNGNNDISPICVADDGSRIVFVLQTGQQALLWIIEDADKSTRRAVTIPVDVGNGWRCSSTTLQYVFLLGRGAVVIDTIANRTVASYPDNGIRGGCLSSDGQALVVAHWNYIEINVFQSNSYTLAGRYTGSGAFYFCGISDNGIVASVWNFKLQQQFVSTYQISSARSKLLFNLAFPGANPDKGGYNYPSALRISPQGDYAAVSSWGNGVNAPTISVVDIKAQKIAYTMVTTGSMHAVDVAQVGSGILFSAGGRAVPNPVLGNGGDLYALQFQA